jgi:acyl dehydratase
MAVSTAAIGKAYPPVTYAVGREKIREYAHAIGETAAAHLDLDAARAAGYADLVAPRMFCVVYAGPALRPVMFDPEVGIDYARLVHGAQEFRWGAAVVAGDEVTTEVRVSDISTRGAMTFYVLESASVNQHGAPVCHGTWTNIVRGA